MKMYRQGDVLLVKAERPQSLEGMREVARDKGRVVLAYGEVTGHAHALADEGVTLYENVPGSAPLNDNARLLVVERPTSLRHEEHAPIELEEGFYFVVQQREYDPSQGEAAPWLPVAD